MNGALMTSKPLLQLEPPGADAPLWRCFDHQWYACAYLDDVGEEADFATLQRHYHTQGAAQGHAPNRYFDEAWYRVSYPDVAAAIAAGVVRSGFEHYCRDGFRDRQPHWLYDDAVYLANAAPDSAAADPAVLAGQGFANAYDHFLRQGARRGVVGHLLFDPAAYEVDLADEPGAAAAIQTMGAWHHFLARIWFEQRDAVPSPCFDPDWFLAHHPAASARVAAGEAVCALHAYLTAPPEEACNPLPAFDEAYYLATNPDVAAGLRAGRFRSGYDHFLRMGAQACRQPAPEIDLRRYFDTTAAVRVAIATGASRDAFRHLLLSGDAAPSGHAAPDRPIIIGGHVDSHGYAALAEGWVFIGWIPRAVVPPGTQLRVTARFARGERSGKATLMCFPRPDVAAQGLGALLFLPQPDEPGDALSPGGLVELEIETAEGLVRLPAPAADRAMAEEQLTANALGCLAAIPPAMPGASVPGPDLARLRVLLTRQPFTGTNTIGDLRDRLFLEVDETVLCPALEPGGRAGLVLCGWMLASTGTVARVRVHSGGRVVVSDFRHALRIDRPDVLESVGSRQGLPDLRSGYLLYVPDIIQGDDSAYLEVTTTRGEVGYRPLPAPKLRGMEAMRFLLDRAELRYGEVAPAFDHVYGPSIQRLNADRLRAPPEYQTIEFGPQPEAPELSLIVTLFGRLDFIEYQLAFFSRHAAAMPFELVYVLDDPPRRRQLETLAASAFARFGIPFRLVLLSRNLGFAPANNVGLEVARAPYVCFLNSDVFPGTDDWMEQLVDRLRDTPDLGAVGPLLLYEDGCVQHQGMNFERLPAFADWHFPMHPGKGWRPDHIEGLHPCLAITGACVVMARDLAMAVGGFDPSFAIGDFEDSDLCLKLRARGLDCAVDAGVHLYHLERQSQVGSEHRWRMNLTLYNAWLHESRWGATLALESSSGQEDKAP